MRGRRKTARQTRWQRQHRRARLDAGRCVDCGEPSDGCHRCEPCRIGVNAHRAYVRALGRLGKALVLHLRAAADEERELRLPLPEVRGFLRALDER